MSTAPFAVDGRSTAVGVVIPTASVVVWKGVVPIGPGHGPGEWLHCPACGAREPFPHGGHGRALLMEALDTHLTHTGGGHRDG